MAHEQEIGTVSLNILKVCIKKAKAGDDNVLPSIYMKKEEAKNYSSFQTYTNYWGIRLDSPTLVYIASKVAKRTPFQLDEWSIHVEKSQRIKITWLDSKQAYEVACFAFS
ncbi:hypothetical protein FPQ18DRAFT_384200 [Pyronema domesticum]|nr:hypothetical protein FPQ18DRAFT_384200 [Pyronema domesticum]